MSERSEPREARPVGDGEGRARAEAQRIGDFLRVQLAQYGRVTEGDIAVAQSEIAAALAASAAPPEGDARIEAARIRLATMATDCAHVGCPNGCTVRVGLCEACLRPVIVDVVAMLAPPASRSESPKGDG